MTIAVIASAMAILSVLHSDTDNSSAEVVESGWCGENAYYHIYSDGTLLIDGSGAMYDYSGLSRAPWYEHHDGITKIVIGDNITHLGQWAFVKCKHVKELTIPITLNSVTVDTSCVFASCYNIEKINFTVGVDGYGFDYAAYLGNNAWYQLTPWYQSKDVLKEIHFADGITHIGADAFRELNITSIVLPDSVTSLGCHCFFNCTELTDLTIPVSLNSYGNEDYPAFAGCMAVNKVVFTRGNGVPFDYTNWLGMHNAGLAPWNLNYDIAKTIIISDDVPDLGCCMFYYCNVRELTVPVNISLSAAFKESSSNLEKVTLTKGTGAGYDYGLYQSIFYCPWSHVMDIDTITVEDGVTYLGNYTFTYCGVKNLILPNSLSNFGESAFLSCNIVNLTIPISLNAVCSDSDPAFDSVSGIENITLTPGSGDGYNYGACEGCNCWYQLTPWYQCRGTLKEIVFEDGIKHIGSDAFRELNITSLVIPDSVESLGNHTFYHCKNLVVLTIPMNLNSVYSDKYPAFDQCDAIEYMHFTAGHPIGFDYANQTGKDCWFGYTPWYQCIDTVKEITIDSGILRVGTHTFDGYIFYGQDYRQILPEAQYLSGHTFVGENGVLYLDDCVSDASSGTSLSDHISPNSIEMSDPLCDRDMSVELYLVAEYRY